MNAIKAYRKPRDIQGFLKAFRFWLLDSFECGIDEEFHRGDCSEFKLNFDAGRPVFVVASRSRDAALAAMLTPEELAAVAKVRKGAGRA